MALPYSLDLSRLSGAYQSGELTPTRVVEDALGEIEALSRANPAWIYVMPREALLWRAAELERRRSRGESLPLYGVPFAVKDNIDVAGHPTSAGCPAFTYVASQTAHAVQRLEHAGAILLGKTNMDQFATGLVGTRSPYGACTNPFDSRYIAGGSSSGSAVSVALGHVSFALGTDTAGSGRVPAGYCNVVGLKPTRGLISMSGIVPACRSLDCVSIFALTAEDAVEVCNVAAGYDAADPYSRSDKPAPVSHAAAHIRCGVPRADQLEFCGDTKARRAFERALKTLASLGAELVEIDYAPFAETASLLYGGPWVAERLAAIRPFFETSAHLMHPITREIIGAASRFTAVDVFDAQHRLEALKLTCSAAWRHIDMLVVPTAPTIYRIEEVEAEPVTLNSNLGLYTNFVNLLDLSAIAIPAGFREDRLPFGITLIAPALEDPTLAHWGSRFHHAAVGKLGATRFLLPGADDTPGATDDSGVTLAVVGAHLSGMPLNHQLTSRGARLLEACATAPQYRLYALPDTTPPKPGLSRAHNGSGSTIEVELWSVPVKNFGAFVADVPSPLAIGTVVLADGRQVKGFVCESYALNGARDISSYGGWRKFVTQAG
ncbi:MAG: allophanate hydrolase [Betaproteobacteria bacterium]|nr:allophanate hydrolase [Betaproteobacteria bacterium]